MKAKPQSTEELDYSRVRVQVNGHECISPCGFTYDWQRSHQCIIRAPLRLTHLWNRQEVTQHRNQRIKGYDSKGM